MELQHHHFCEFVSAPDRLDDVYSHIRRELSALRRMSLSRVQRIKLLMTGSSSALASGITADGGDLTTFPDARRVERTPQSMALYLERLIAPDDVADVREVICEYLGLETPAVTGDLLAELNKTAPEIVTALLELRVGRAHRLIRDLMERPSRADPEDSPDYRILVSEIGRVRVAYVLRIIAQDCGRQIHAPYGWDALDRVDDAAAHGTPRTGSVVKRIKSELELTQQILKLSTRDPPSAAENGAGPKDRLRQAEDEFISSLGLNDRARVQLAIWRAHHGDQLELVLSSTIKAINYDVLQLGNDIDARLFAAKSNSIVGNFNRTPAGVRLHFAVERAIAWTGEACRYAREDGTPCDSSDGIRERRADPRQDHFEVLAAWLTQSSRGRGEAPSPQPRHEHAFRTARLFVALRLAFLRDAEMLPIRLRTIKDPNTGKKTHVKTPEKAAQIKGKPYSFSELLKVFEEDLSKRVSRLPTNATASAQSKANQIDYDMKRSARRLRRLPAKDRPVDMEEAETTFDALVMQGYLAD